MPRHLLWALGVSRPTGEAASPVSVTLARLLLQWKLGLESIATPKEKSSAQLRYSRVRPMRVISSSRGPPPQNQKRGACPALAPAPAQDRQPWCREWDFHGWHTCSTNLGRPVGAVDKSWQLQGSGAGATIGREMKQLASVNMCSRELTLSLSCCTCIFAVAR